MEEKRLQIIIDELLMSVPEFAISIKISPDTVYNILHGKTKISPYVKGNLFKAYPNINRDWFEKGVGEMYLKDSDKDITALNEKKADYDSGCKSCREKDIIIEEYKKIISQQRELIDQLKDLQNLKKNK